MAVRRTRNRQDSKGHASRPLARAAGTEKSRRVALRFRDWWAQSGPDVRVLSVGGVTFAFCALVAVVSVIRNFNDSFEVASIAMRTVGVCVLLGWCFWVCSVVILISARLPARTAMGERNHLLSVIVAFSKFVGSITALVTGGFVGAFVGQDLSSSYTTLLSVFARNPPSSQRASDADLNVAINATIQLVGAGFSWSTFVVTVAEVVLMLGIPLWIAVPLLWAGQDARLTALTKPLHLNKVGIRRTLSMSSEWAAHFASPLYELLFIVMASALTWSISYSTNLWLAMLRDLALQLLDSLRPMQ